MAIYDLIELNLNDSVERYYKDIVKIISLFYKGMECAIKLLINIKNKIFPNEILVNERIIEYPLLFQNIRNQGRVLDVGCYSSRLPIELASLGRYEVYGVDCRRYNLQHKKFKFILCDIMSLPFGKEFFDIITVISTIEHVGLGGYGDPQDLEGDRKAMEGLIRVLKSNGQMILTVPFGKRMVTKKHRVYDYESIVSLISGLWIQDEICFIRRDMSWQPCHISEAEIIDSPSLPVNAIVFLNLVKGNKSES